MLARALVPIHSAISSSDLSGPARQPSRTTIGRLTPLTTSTLPGWRRVKATLLGVPP